MAVTLDTRHAQFDTRNSALDTPTIRVLPPELISRIAAGEVIERPASVVKELAENSLDAGATRVHVELSGGGTASIRVNDDGIGMSEADLSLAVLQHATSKLTSADDLSALSTLGFRGEALPSIASVSKFSITTRTKGADAACQLELEGGRPLKPEVKPAAGPYGTTVEARELFFNLPARKKFLKGQASESAACTETLLRLALSRPDVGFALSQDRREIFSCMAERQGPGARGQGPATPIDRADPTQLSAAPFFRRARELLGRANTEALLELDAIGARTELMGEGGSPEHETRNLGPVLALPEIPRGYRLFGLLSPPATTRPNRAQIYLNVNGRPVKDRTLTSALLEAYRQLLPPKRYPIAVLFLELPCADVDHNVHPAKAEVRFRVPGLVYALLHRAIRQGLGGVAGVEGRVASEQPELKGPGVRGQGPDGRAANDELRMTNEPRAATASESFPSYAPAPAPIPHTPLGAPRAEPAQRRFDLWPTVAPASANGAPAEARAAQPARHSTLDIRHSSPFRVLGQAGGSYIVLEDDTGVKLIDQHALHERVLFELFLKRAADSARGDSQGLLTPVVLELTPIQSAAYSQGDATRDLLMHLGFDTSSFGERSIAVRSIPTIFKSAEKARLVLEVLDAITDTSDDDPGRSKLTSRFSLREKACYMLACKAAIKAGERLTVEQMSAMVEDYRRLAGPHGFTCPHGRPVALELAWEELERSVGR